MDRYWIWALLIGTAVGFSTYLIGRIIQLFAHPEGEIATLNPKSRRFFFQNEQFQAAFAELNSEGYYRLSNKVGW